MNRQALDLETLLGHGDFLRSLARGLLRDDDAADDVVQETMVEALRKKPCAGWDLRAWLAGVVRNLARNRKRSDARRRARELVSASRIAAARPAARSAADVLGREEVRRQVVEELLVLPEPYRSVLLLHYFDGLPPREIARRTNVPGATARSQLSRGRALLRARLDRKPGGRAAWSLALFASTNPRTRLIGAAVALLVLALAAGVLAVGTTFGASSPQRAARTGPSVDAGDRERGPGAGNHVTAREPGDIDLQVVSTDGSGVEGVRIVAVHESDAATQAVTDARGRARLDPEFSGRCALWFSTAEVRWQTARVLEPGTSLVRMPGPAHTIAFRFRDGSGNPMSGHEARRLYRGAALVPQALVVSESEFTSAAPRGIASLLLGQAARWSRTEELRWTDDGATLARRIAGGPWRIYLERPGLSPLRTAVVRPDRGVEIDVPLGPKATRRVRLVAADTGKPLADATVRPFTHQASALAYVEGAPRATNYLGEVELPVHRGTGRRAPVWWIRAPGRMARLLNEDLRPSGGKTLVIEVPKHARIEGTAFLRSGAPAEGRRIFCRQKGFVQATTVDRYGVFAFAAAGPYPADLILVEDFAAGVVSVQEVRLEPAATARVAVGAALRGASVVARVTAGGATIASGEATFLLKARESGRLFFAPADARGVLRVDGIPPGAVDLTIMLGDVRVSGSHKFESRAPFELAAGEVRRFDLDLPGGALRVEVVDDATGRPVAAASVVAAPTRTDQGRRYSGLSHQPGWAAFTDASGRAVLRGLAPETPHRVRVRAEGHAELTSLLVPQVGPKRAARLRLRRIAAR